MRAGGVDGSANKNGRGLVCNDPRGTADVASIPAVRSVETRHIEDVLENILRVPSLPIGALLVHEVGHNEVFHSGPISGGPTPTSMPQMNLLDGQQRMTALWRSLTDDYDEFTRFVSLRDEESPEIEIVKRHLSKSGNRMLLWADSPTECLERNLAPVSMLCPGSKSELAMDEWTEAAGTEKGTDRRIMRYRQRLKRVFNIDIKTCNSWWWRQALRLHRSS